MKKILFIFKSPNFGIFSETWQFVTRPVLMGGAAIQVRKWPEFRGSAEKFLSYYSAPGSKKALRAEPLILLPGILCFSTDGTKIVSRKESQSRIWSILALIFPKC